MGPIVVHGIEYRWRHGSDTTEVRRVDGSVLCRESNAVLIGVDQGSYERGAWKRTSDCVVTPRHIADLITRTVAETGTTSTAIDAIEAIGAIRRPRAE